MGWLTFGKCIYDIKYYNINTFMQAIYINILRKFMFDIGNFDVNITLFFSTYAMFSLTELL